MIYLTDKHQLSHYGKITRYTPIGDTDALLFIEGSNYGVYLRNIRSYVMIPKTDSIFTDKSPDCLDKVALMAEKKTFTVNKSVLSQKSSFFRNILQKYNNVVSENTPVDLNGIFTGAQLEAVLLTIEAGICRVLSLEQAKTLLRVARDRYDLELYADASARIAECLEGNTKEFLFAIRKARGAREIDYTTCAAMLATGIDINVSFGNHCDGKTCLFEDNALSYATKQGDVELIKWLLDHGANPNVYRYESPLLIACSTHNVKIVQLLLEAGVDPNENDGFAMIKTVECVSHYSQKNAADIMKLLLDFGYTAKEPPAIAKWLHTIDRPSTTIQQFYRMWKNQNSKLDQAYTIGATVSVLSDHLPPELGMHIGKFFDRTTGGRLARVSKDAAKTAKEAQERQKLSLKTVIK
jgi:hypothetical protein